MRLVGGDWKHWLPPLGHSLHDEFQELETHLLGELYSDQKEILDAIHEKELDDVFAASYSSVSKNEGSRAVTCCVWEENVHSLLPKAHFITCVGDEEIRALASWDQVLSDMGDSIQLEEGCYPKRHRVRGFPALEQLDAIDVVEFT